MGHEQEGRRPAIVLADIGQADLIVAVPMTGELTSERFKFTLRISPSAKNNLKEDGIALVFQIRALDKNRLVEKIGQLDDKDIASINIILKDILKLQDSE